MADVIFRIRGEPEPDELIELEWFIEKNASSSLIQLCVKDSITGKEWNVCTINKRGMKLSANIPEIGLETDKNGKIVVLDDINDLY